MRKSVGEVVSARVAIRPPPPHPSTISEVSAPLLWPPLRLFRGSNHVRHQNSNILEFIYFTVLDFGNNENGYICLYLSALHILDRTVVINHHLSSIITYLNSFPLFITK